MAVLKMHRNPLDLNLAPLRALWHQAFFDRIHDDETNSPIRIVSITAHPYVALDDEVTQRILKMRMLHVNAQTKKLHATRSTVIQHLAAQPEDTTGPEVIVLSVCIDHTAHTELFAIFCTPDLVIEPISEKIHV